MSTNEAPTTNPDVGVPIETRNTQPRHTRIDGADLVPDTSSPGAHGVLRQYKYWVGVTPSCPVEHIDCAGINFPKVNENIVPDPLRTSQKKRVPVIGAIVFLTEDKIRKMRERLPRTVIRFLDDAGVKEEPGTGQNVGDNHQRPRRGHLITIPTAEDVARARKTGRPSRQYIPQTSDAPAARFMFAQLCDDQERGSRGEFYPEPLEVTGLEWPDALEELQDIFD